MWLNGVVRARTLAAFDRWLPADLRDRRTSRLGNELYETLVIIIHDRYASIPSAGAMYGPSCPLGSVRCRGDCTTSCYLGSVWHRSHPGLPWTINHYFYRELDAGTCGPGEF